MGINKIEPFKLGFFVLSGAAIAVAGLIWIGAVHFFRYDKPYVTFFDYSVKGLKTGAVVDHLGIQVGRVSSISLTRNGQLIKVIMRLESDFKVKKDEAVEMKLAGITGGHYLAIVKAPENLQEITPRIDFPTEYPLIPSAKGIISRIEDSLGDIFKQFHNLNTKGFLSSWAEVGKNANSILTGGDINEILSNLRESSVSLEKVLNGIGRPETVQEINRSINDIAAISSSLRKASADISRQIEEIPPKSFAGMTERMEKAASETEQVVGSMGTQVDQTISLLRQSVRQINQVLSELESLVRSLREEPGRILKQPGGNKPFER